MKLLNWIKNRVQRLSVKGRLAFYELKREFFYEVPRSEKYFERLGLWDAGRYARQRGRKRLVKYVLSTLNPFVLFKRYRRLNKLRDNHLNIIVTTEVSKAFAISKLIIENRQGSGIEPILTYKVIYSLLVTKFYKYKFIMFLYTRVGLEGLNNSYLQEIFKRFSSGYLRGDDHVDVLLEFFRVHLGDEFKVYRDRFMYELLFHYQDILFVVEHLKCAYRDEELTPYELFLLKRVKYLTSEHYQFVAKIILSAVLLRCEKNWEFTALNKESMANWLEKDYFVYKDLQLNEKHLSFWSDKINRLLYDFTSEHKALKTPIIPPSVLKYNRYRSFSLMFHERYILFLNDLLDFFTSFELAGYNLFSSLVVKEERKKYPGNEKERQDLLKEKPPLEKFYRKLFRWFCFFFIVFCILGFFFITTFFRFLCFVIVICIFSSFFFLYFYFFLSKFLRRKKEKEFDEKVEAEKDIINLLREEKKKDESNNNYKSFSFQKLFLYYISILFPGKESFNVEFSQKNGKDDFIYKVAKDNLKKHEDLRASAIRWWKRKEVSLPTEEDLEFEEVFKRVSGKFSKEGLNSLNIVELYILLEKSSLFPRDIVNSFYARMDTLLENSGSYYDKKLKKRLYLKKLDKYFGSEGIAPNDFLNRFLKDQDNFFEKLSKLYGGGKDKFKYSDNVSEEEWLKEQFLKKKSFKFFSKSNLRKKTEDEEEKKN